MSLALYFLIILPFIVCLFILLYLFFRKNDRTELYSKGLRNENDGHFNQALINYQQALNESGNLKMEKKFREKITQRIKILRTAISYKDNFKVGENTN